MSTGLNQIKYLSDNGFTVLTMSDLEYDEVSNTLKIKDKTLPAASLINVTHDNHGNGDINNTDNDDDVSS